VGRDLGRGAGKKGCARGARGNRKEPVYVPPRVDLNQRMKWGRPMFGEYRGSEAAAGRENPKSIDGRNGSVDTPALVCCPKRWWCGA